MRNKNIVFKILIPLFSLGMCTSLIGCEGGFNPTPTPVEPEVHVDSVSIIGESIVNVGSATTFKADILPRNATNKKVVWSSTDPNVLFVDPNGLVTALKKGSATIKAVTDDGSKTNSLSVNVVAKDVIICKDIQEFGEAMKSSEYQINAIAPRQFGVENYGKDVGVNSYAIKELYKVKKDNKFDLIINVDELNSEDVDKYFPGKPLNDFYKIATAISMAKELDDDEYAKIKFTKDKIYKCDASESQSTYYLYEVNALKNTDFEGNNATIQIVTKPEFKNEGPYYNFTGYFNFSGCENILINGFTFEEDVPCYLCGDITYDFDKHAAIMDVYPEFNCFCEKIINYKNKNGEFPMPKCYTEFEYAYEHIVPIEEANLVASQEFKKPAEIEGNSLDGYTATIYFRDLQTINDNFGAIANLLYAQYDAPALYFRTNVDGDNCKDIFIDGLNIYDANGMALVAENVHNLYINRYNLIPNPARSGYLSAAADGSHFNYCTGDLKITNSQIVYCNDDSLNIKHGYWYAVSSVEPNQKEIGLSSKTSPVPTPKIGDKVKIYKADDLTFVKEVAITGVSGAPSLFKLSIDATPDESWVNCIATFCSNTAKFEFSNNIVGYKRNRGILVQVPDAQIFNNTFNYVGQGSIQCATSLDIFNECTIPTAPHIYNNKFMNSNYMAAGGLYGDVSVFAGISNSGFGVKGVIQDALIENNFFTNNGNSAIALCSVGGNTICDSNFFYDAVTSSRAGDESIFSCINSEGITVSNCYNETFSSTQVGISLSGTTEQKTFTLENNVNIEFKKISEFGPEVYVDQFDGSGIIIDGDLSEWEGTNAHDIELDGVSFADNLTGLLDELEPYVSVIKKYMTFDDKGIYFGFEIFDNFLDFEKPTQFFNGDCIEILGTTIVGMPDADLQVYKNYEEGGTLQVAYGLDYGQGAVADQGWNSRNNTYLCSARTSNKYMDGESDIQTAMKVVGNHYILETMLPFSVFTDFKTAIDEGRQINFAVVIADNGRPRGNLDAYRLQIGNVPHFVEKTKIKSQLMPQYYFLQNI